jgi:hypothetical protein
MAKLRDVAAYCCKHFPQAVPLTLNRLAKVLYLADWRSAIKSGALITDIDWRLTSGGLGGFPVSGFLSDDSEFKVVRRGLLGPKDVVSYTGPRNWPSVSQRDAKHLDFAIKTASQLDQSALTALVYSTYPFLARSSNELNLVTKAKEYTRDRELLAAR